MSDTGLAIFDETVAETNAWLNEIQSRAGVDRQGAYHVLRAGLHAIRDRLTPEEAAHLAAQLPLLIRGIYYENWRPGAVPGTERSPEAWLDRVSAELRAGPADARTAAEAAFALLKTHCDAGELNHVRAQLPGGVRDIMEAA